MIKLKDKQEIILMHIRDGKSRREIARITGRDRKTVAKYINEYEEKRQKLIGEGSIVDEELINSIVEKPKYDASSRKKKVVTDEILKRIQHHLDENTKKLSSGMHKQIKKKIDIYESLIDEGFKIGYTTVCQTISKMLNESKEAFIRSEYKPGEVCEFDWGHVKLCINGTWQILKMAAFCTAHGNYRFGRLYVNEKTQSFMDAHVEFFSHIKGNHRTIVYDNAKTAMKRFVGFNEKEPTEALLKLSLYYGYQYRFCNAYSGNEKGRVERTVEYLRRKAFSDDLDNLEFSSIEEANEHLSQVCERINSYEQRAIEDRTAFAMLEEEREYLMPELPSFDCSVVRNYRVNKYSTVNIDSCFYSVPDIYVDKLVLVKVYTNKIIIYHEDNKIANHAKLLGFGKWSLEIDHYLNTLMKKPGAVPNSLALQQANSKIKNLYHKHFTTNNRDFVELLLFIKENDIKIESIEESIQRILSISPIDISTEKIKILCNKQGSNNSHVYDKSEVYEKSKDMLSSYGNLLYDSSNKFCDMEVI